MSLSIAPLYWRAAVLIASLVLILSLPGISMAAPDNKSESEPAKVSLSEFIAAGLRDNPGIKAKRLAYESVKRRRPQATALADPMLQYTQPFQEIETRLGPNKRSVSLMQRVPYPGKLKLKGSIASKDTEVAGVALDKAARDLVLDIKKAYYDIFYLDKAKNLARERIKVFEHFSKAEMNDYSVGTAKFSDVISAETRFADAEYDLILFSQLRKGAASRLNTLLGLDPEYNIPEVNEPQISADFKTLTELYPEAGGNESIRAADLMIEKSRLAEELSKFTYRPNFVLGVKYTEIGAPEMSSISDGGRDAVAVTFGLTIPLWGGKNRAAREEARLNRLQSEQARAALTDGLNARLTKAFIDMKSNYQLVKLYTDSLLPKAEKLIDTVEINYKNGNGSIADLFESRVMWINFSLAYYRAASNYLINRAELERLTAGFSLKEVALHD